MWSDQHAVSCDSGAILRDLVILRDLAMWIIAVTAKVGVIPINPKVGVITVNPKG